MKLPISKEKGRQRYQAYRILEYLQTISSPKSEICRRRDANWINEWEEGGGAEAVKSYLEVGLQPSTRAKSMPEFDLQREVFGWLIAARSGHGHFVDLRWEIRLRRATPTVPVRLETGTTIFILLLWTDRTKPAVQETGEAAFTWRGIGHARGRKSLCRMGHLQRRYLKELEIGGHKKQIRLGVTRGTRRSLAAFFSSHY